MHYSQKTLFILYAFLTHFQYLTWSKILEKLSKVFPVLLDSWVHWVSLIQAPLLNWTKCLDQQFSMDGHCNAFNWIFIASLEWSTDVPWKFGGCIQLLVEPMGQLWAPHQQHGLPWQWFKNSWCALTISAHCQCATSWKKKDWKSLTNPRQSPFIYVMKQLCSWISLGGFSHQLRNVSQLENCTGRTLSFLCVFDWAWQGEPIL